MLDEFLQVAYTTQTRKQAQYELVGLMEGLPVVELKKIASGTPIAELYGHLDKTAYMAEACNPDGTPKSFLEKFKGTPLFEQALALEQQELQAEMTDMQKRQERRQQNAADDSLYDAKDRLRVQKRLLELELAKQEMGGAAAPPGAPAPGATPAQGAGAPGEVPPEGVEAGAGGVVGKTAQAHFRFADGLGRELARADFAKAAHAAQLEHVGVAAGAVLAKTANPLAGIGGALAGLAKSPGVGKALSFAAKNPAMVGAGLGAAGGAIAGGPDHRLSGALGGAALGGAAGHMAPGMMQRMGRGMGALDAAKGSAQQAMGGLRSAVNPQVTPHGAMSAAPVKMPKPTYADPSVLHAAQPPGATPLNAPNPMSFGAPSLKQRMMGLVG